jgi:hypothetical protein
MFFTKRGDMIKIRSFSSIARMILIGFGMALGLSVQPTEACGCGAYVPHDGDGFVSQEQALLRWDGATEQIVMSLGVLGASKEAAVIMPVPSRATVKLGDGKIFDQLRDLTKPLVRIEKRSRGLALGVGAAPPEAAARVTVLDRQTLGPFDVSTLAATDAEALSTWLRDNGYSISPKLSDALQAYVAKGWFYVAVRLQPGAGETLQGALDPLWITFSSNTLVYPMRASANARSQQTVTLYVLAAHRVQKSAQFGVSHVSFADWVDPSAVNADPALVPFVTGRLFLTKFQESVDPTRVNDDFVFTFAATDESAHDYVVQYEDDNTLAGIEFLILVCFVIGLPLLLLAAVGVGLVIFVRRQRKQDKTVPAA